MGATPEELKAIRRLGLKLQRFQAPEELLKTFPPADSNYHDYAETLLAQLAQGVQHGDRSRAPVEDRRVGGHGDQAASTG
ncbi:MAG: hypothetical protein WAM82_15040 [Thermoanaerobaculia bacterium]